MYSDSLQDPVWASPDVHTDTSLWIPSDVHPIPTFLFTHYKPCEQCFHISFRRALMICVLVLHVDSAVVMDLHLKANMKVIN